MEIFLSILFLFIGTIHPLFSAVIYYLSQDTISDLIEKNYKSAQRLRTLKVEFDELVNPYIIWEFIFYSISVFLLLKFMDFQSNIDPLLNTAIFVLFIISLVILRFFMQATGIKLANQLAPALSGMIYSIYFISKPLTYVINILNKSIVGKPDVEESRDEISELVESAHEEGAIDTEEYRILKNIMNFSEILVSDVMTPRTVIFSCSSDLTVDELAAMQELQMYSRFPVWEGDAIDDGIIGYAMSKDVLIAALNGKGNLKVKDFVREIYFIPENAELDTALERFLNRRQHMFMVVDEYGGIEGLITMEDVLETILGVEIVDEVDKVVDLRQLAKQRRDSRIASL